ncbi:MAG: MBL fold metallo-hydrolase [Chloroflexi bacterium]|nr:MBL fold metallo-hydrolase [Chloroflexota bacterium]
MSTTLRFLGASGYEVVGPTFRLLLEPYLTGNPVAPCGAEDLEPPDAILVSHAAWDHSLDAAGIAIRTGAPVICPNDVAEMLLEAGVPAEQVRPSIWGVCYAFGDVVVRPVECHHWSAATLKDGRIVTGVPLSFIVETEPGVRLYHFGDTTIFPGMRMLGELYTPTVGILGCAQTDGLPDPGAGSVLTGEMTPDEAARAAEWLGVRQVVATHYMHPGPEVAELARRVPVYDSTGQRTVHALQGGEELTIEPVPGDYPSLTWGRTSPEWDHSYRPQLTSGPIPTK